MTSRPDPTPAVPAARGIVSDELLHNFRQVFQVLLGLLLIYAFFWIAAPNFRSPGTLIIILNQATILAILAAGTTVVLISGGLDLSVGSIFAVVSVLVGIFLKIYELPVWLTVVLALLVGTSLGFLNGVVQVVSKVPAFIVTLGGLTAYRGVAELLGSGRDLARFPEAFRAIGSGWVVAVAIMFSVATVTWLFLTRTKLGNHAYAIGGNEEVARVSGINVARSRVIYYAIGGLTAAIAAIVQVSRLDFANSARGVSFELLAIAAVVIGGTSLFGGRGGVFRTIVGMLIIQTIVVGLAFMGVGSSVQRIAIGVIIVLAVFLDVWQRRTS